MFQKQSNGRYPDLDVAPDTGRSLKAVYPTAGGLLFWYADDQLPMVRHVVRLEGEALK